MATMKEVWDKVGLSYETLRFYCNERLVPNVKRNKNNHRVFDERDIGWLLSLQCLRKCGMGVNDMKTHMNLCMQGKSSIPERKQILADQKSLLICKLEEIENVLNL